MFLDKGFGEDVCKPAFSSNKLNLTVTITGMITNKVKSNLNMFGSRGLVGSDDVAVSENIGVLSGTPG